MKKKTVIQCLIFYNGSEPFLRQSDSHLASFYITIQPCRNRNGKGSFRFQLVSFMPKHRDGRTIALLLILTRLNCLTYYVIQYNLTRHTEYSLTSGKSTSRTSSLLRQNFVFQVNKVIPLHNVPQVHSENNRF